MAEQRKGPRTHRQRNVVGQVHIGVFLIRPPRLPRLRQKGGQVLITHYDRVRRAGGRRRAREVGVVVGSNRLEGLASLGPYVVGLGWMNVQAQIDARVDVVGRV